MAEPASEPELEELKNEEGGEEGERDVDVAHDRDNPEYNEWVEIDFFINVALGDAEEKIVQVIVDTCNVKPEQVTDVSIQPQDTRTRVTLRIMTDAWEMSTLSQTVTKLVPEKVLSQSLLDTLALDKRPRVTQFFAKSSISDGNTGIPTISQPDKYPYDPEERKSASRRSIAKKEAEEKARLEAGASAEISVDNDKPNQGTGCGCNIL